ncbi:hypothetical protein BRARA_I04304 [Brassica rapa]|uniref:Uncharacterized protein n=1 Tax=Brassica campestris TaxID=3711 RepID=A0A397Y2A9_BRACM|nr:hypothetical protein BRARA_I04304 [Brassica rapa]
MMFAFTLPSIITRSCMLEPSNTIVDKNHCGERGSNTRPSDLQSDALPTELSPQFVISVNYFYLSIPLLLRKPFESIL